MNSNPSPDHARLDDLLADQALFGLDQDEQRELTQLLGKIGGHADAAHDLQDLHDPRSAHAELERTVAALSLQFVDAEPNFDEAGTIENRDEMPATMRERIHDAGRVWFDMNFAAPTSYALEPTDDEVGTNAGHGESADEPPAPLPMDLAKDLDPSGGDFDAIGMPRQAARAGWLPWLVAAACFALSAVLWVRSLSPAIESGIVIQDDNYATADLLARADVKTPWESADGTITGQVVWDSKSQKGFIVVDGLPSNDPADFQYQLWIFDADRARYSTHTAVDGGVFDIPAKDGEVIIPIDAKLKVSSPTLFAITSEPPGGVVEHNPEHDPERYRIVATAAVTSA